jgi:hypothetical protein
VATKVNRTHFYKIRLRLFFKLQVVVTKKTKKLLLLNRAVPNLGLAQVGLDGRTMISWNAAVQQLQRDVTY